MRDVSGDKKTSAAKKGGSLLGAALERAVEAKETSKSKPAAKSKPKAPAVAKDEPATQVSAAKKALSSSGKSKTRDRAASAGLTSQQSETLSHGARGRRQCTARFLEGRKRPRLPG